MGFSLNTPFQCYNAIINGSLDTLHEIYFRALGEDTTPPSESRIAKQPAQVLADMVLILKSAAIRLHEAQEAVRELSLDE